MSSEQRSPAPNGPRPFGLRANVREAALRDLAREQPLPASRVLPRARWHRNTARQQTSTDPSLGEKGAEDAAATLKNSNRLAITIALLAIAAIAVMGLMLARKIVNALNEAVKIAQTVAAGDLTTRIEVTSKDETGQLLQALKEMSGSLVKIVGEVRTGADTIATASGQIASGNLDLSSRTEQQASALEETAS